MLYIRKTKKGDTAQAALIKNNVIHYYPGTPNTDVSGHEIRYVESAREMADIITDYKAGGYILRNYAAPADTRKGSRKQYESTI